MTKRFRNDQIQGDITDILELYKQEIQNFIGTEKGSQPSRPDFGTNVLKYLQMGINQAEPLIKNDIYNGLIKYFPQLGKPYKISIIYSNSDPTKASFLIVYRNKNTELEVVTNAVRVS
jgi:phage baseplate assembly protein W